MKYRLLIITVIAALASIMPGCSAKAENRGVPFIRNFSAQEYGAHTRNFDVACDEYGSVYFANFSCILYYDGATWRKIYSPGISRITRIMHDTQRKKIWFGGYNIFGYLAADKNGKLGMKVIASDKSHSRIGEVDMIKATEKSVYVHTMSQKTYIVDEDRRLVPFHGDVSFIDLSMSNVALQYTSKVRVSMQKEGGLLVRDETRHRVITEADGLCSNKINFIMYDQDHTVWGATDHGIFAIEIPSPYSHITDAQGLKGEVYTINEIGHTIYVGTLQGLYRIDDGRVTKVLGINNACWELKKNGSNGLLASTMDGLFKVTQQGISPITTYSTMSVCIAPQGGYYASELDHLYYVSPNGKRTQIAPIEKGAKMQIIGSVLKVETINGEVWNVALSGNHKATMVRAMEDVTEPQIEYTDCFGRKWLTDPEGKDLSVITSKQSKALERWIHPFSLYTLNCIFCSKSNSLWVGGDFGIINCDISMIGTNDKTNIPEPLYIRQIRMTGDSVIWGGYSQNDMMPLRKISGIKLPSDCRHLVIDFSARYNSFFEPTQYRFRVNGGHWSAWTTDTHAEFNNMSYGATKFEVEGLDIFGNTSEISSVEWYVAYPFYLQWYAFLIYFLVILGVVRAIMRYKEKKLEADNAHLESIVNKRTAELSNTLDELQRTQADLVRMERTATAGKLTQGLIDRILNPINYINNFSKLTSGLAKDLREDIDDEKDNMSEDNYDDCQDVLDMMAQNLSKIEEHGVNATRTLRAMEAMLNTHVGALKTVDVVTLCKQTYQVAADYYKEDIEKYKISFTSKIPDGVIEHDIDQESIANVLKAMLGNAFYAVVKKYQREPYEANVELRLAQLGDNHIEIIVHDNGIGIEESIKEKVFDPFFTTKTTGEASGVGLYLAREIIQDHKGTVTLESLKDNWTNFIISL